MTSFTDQQCIDMYLSMVEIRGARPDSYHREVFSALEQRVMASIPRRDVIPSTAERDRTPLSYAAQHKATCDRIQQHGTEQSRAEQVEAEVSCVEQDTVEPSTIAWDDIEPYTTYRCDDGLVVHVGAVTSGGDWSCASLIHDGTCIMIPRDYEEHPFVKKLGVLRYISDSKRTVWNISFETLRNNDVYHPGEIK